MFLYEIRLKMDKRLHTIDQKGLKLYHWVKKAVWGVEISLESLNIQTQKNNVKFDLKSKYLQISISRTPEEILVTLIHQNHPTLLLLLCFLAEKHKSNIAGRGPDFQDQPKLAGECVSQRKLRVKFY